MATGQVAEPGQAVEVAPAFEVLGQLAEQSGAVGFGELAVEESLDLQSSRVDHGVISSSRSRRSPKILDRARWSRLMTVPIGQPRASATSW